jgi:hypothetical protein
VEVSPAARLVYGCRAQTILAPNAGVSSSGVVIERRSQPPARIYPAEGRGIGGRSWPTRPPMALLLRRWPNSLASGCKLIAPVRPRRIFFSGSRPSAAYPRTRRRWSIGRCAWSGHETTTQTSRLYWSLRSPEEPPTTPPPTRCQRLQQRAKVMCRATPPTCWGQPPPVPGKAPVARHLYRSISRTSLAPPRFAKRRGVSSHEDEE